MKLATPALDEFVELQDLHLGVQDFFRTEDSLRWFIRRNRSQLVKTKALIIVAGRMRFHPTRFKCVVVSVGAALAA